MNQRDALERVLSEVADKVGMIGLVVDGGFDCVVHHDLSPLIEALNQQTAAVHELTRTNQQMIAALLSDDVIDSDDGAEPINYMDGSSVQ